MTDAAARSCPRTGRTRAAALAPGAIRPSDLLVTFLAGGIAWLLAAAAAGTVAAAGVEHARWLALHLAFLGGVSLLVIGAAQFFVCAFLATDPPSRAEVRRQLVVWNGGVVATAIGVPADLPWLAGIGSALVLAGLALFARSLAAMRRRSLQTAPWALRWYLAAAAFLAAGALLGPVMAADARWSHGSLLAAHVVLNLGGWFGTAIVGTLHTFHPSLTGTTQRWPRLQPWCFGAWAAGIATLAEGLAWGVTPLAAAGWALLLGAAMLLAANIVASERAATQRTLAGTLVAAAQVPLVVAAVVGLAATVSDGAVPPFFGDTRAMLAVLLLAGWIGLTVAGSLLHLLGLMGHVRRLHKPAGPRATTPGHPLLGLVPVAAVLLLAGTVAVGADDAVPRAAALAGLCFAMLAARIVILAVRAVTAAPLRV